MGFVSVNQGTPFTVDPDYNIQTIEVTQRIPLMQDRDAFSNKTEHEADFTIFNIFTSKNRF